MAKSGLQRIPLIGRRFAKADSGLYLPPQEDSKLSHQNIPREIPTISERPIVKAEHGHSHDAGKAKRRAGSKRARKARRKNRRH